LVADRLVMNVLRCVIPISLRQNSYFTLSVLIDINLKRIDNRSQFKRKLTGFEPPLRSNELFIS
jgi:hypothetical protein